MIDTSDPTIRHVQRRSLTVLIISQIIGTVGVGVAPSIGILLAGEVTHSEAWAGLARTASTLGAAVFGLPLGLLAARRGRRAALSTGWLTAAVGAALIVLAAQANSIVILFPGLLLIGAGSAVSLQSRFAATDLAEPHRSGRALALVVWVGTIGSVLGPNLGLPGETLSAASGLTVYAAAFAIAAFFLALACMIVLIALRPDPLLTLQQHGQGVPTPGRRRRAGLGRLPALFRENRRARVAIVAVLTAQIVMVAIMTMTPVHVVHQGGTITIVGITISLHIAGMYLLAPLVGLVVDRRNARTAIGIGLGVLVVSLSVAALLPDSMAGIMVSLILLGVGWSFVNVAGSTLFSLAVPTPERAASQGGVDALANLSGAIAAFLAGPFMAATTFSVLAIAALLALVPLSVLTVTMRRRSDPIVELTEEPSDLPR